MNPPLRYNHRIHFMFQAPGTYSLSAASTFTYDFSPLVKPVVPSYISTIQLLASLGVFQVG